MFHQDFLKYWSLILLWQAPTTDQRNRKNSLFKAFVNWMMTQGSIQLRYISSKNEIQGKNLSALVMAVFVFVKPRFLSSSST